MRRMLCFCPVDSVSHRRPHVSRCCCSRTAILTSDTKYSLAALRPWPRPPGRLMVGLGGTLGEQNKVWSELRSLCFGQPSPSPPSILAGDFAPFLRSRCCVALFLQLHRSSPSSPKLTSTSVLYGLNPCAAHSRRSGVAPRVNSAHPVAISELPPLHHC